MVKSQITDLALDAEYYNKHGKWQYKTAAQLLNMVAIRGNEHVLDIGSGDGEVTKEIAKKLPSGHVHGIDISHEMVTFSQSHSETFKNISYQVLNAEDLKAKSKYDLTTSFSTFYWIKNQIKALESIYQALKPGGQLIFMVFPKESGYWKPLISVIELPIFSEYSFLSQHHNFITTDEYNLTLEKIGFKDIKFKIDVLFAEYANKEAYLNYVRGWVRLFVKLPTNDLEEKFLELAYQESCREFEKKSDGSILIPYKKVIITATRDN